MSNGLKHDLLLIAYAIVLFAVAMNLKFIFVILGKAVNLCFPLLVGLLIAFILNTPMRGFEKIIDKVISRLKFNMSNKTKCIISLLLTVVSIFAVIFLTFTLAVPKISESVVSLAVMIDEKIPDLLLFLEDYGIDTEFITDKLSNLNSQQIVKNVFLGIASFFSTAVDATKAAVSFFSTSFLSIVISFYLLIDKNNISIQVKRFLHAVFSTKKVDTIYEVSYLIRDTFTKFLSGQCVEAVVLALLIFTLFSIFGLPYASLISLMAAVLSFVPYLGSFIACIVGTFLTLIAIPQKTLICLLVYLSAQLLEQHFIYPHIVGNSVGLSPFYTIIAVLLGGRIFGVFGMIIFIPLFSVILTVIKRFCQKRQEV